jgi:ABC-2 type transport system ATP-binding protein
VTVQKPSLDEVFLALTGHDTAEAGTEPVDQTRPSESSKPSTMETSR